MANIGTWSVRILANTFGFDSKIDKSKRKTNQFSKSVGLASSKLSAFGSTIVGSLGVSAITSFVQGQLKTIDTLGKTASKLGVATDELQTMQYAANLSGVSSETLNMALQRMVRRLGEAKRGVAEASKVMRLFGLNANELSDMRPFEAFNEFLRAAEKLDQSSRIDVFQKLFDSEGVALVNMVGLNMEKVNRQLREMGVLLSQSDTKQIANTNDELTKMSTQLNAIGARLTIGISPAIQEVSKGFGVANENARKLAKTLGIEDFSIGGMISGAYKKTGAALNAYTTPYQILYDQEQRIKTARGILAQQEINKRNRFGTRTDQYRFPEAVRPQMGISGEDRSSGQSISWNQDFGRQALQFMKRQTFTPTLAPSVDN